ncbi:MAG: M6 family metalloprotease domain-containing protein [Planctomycetota bacterium]
MMRYYFYILIILVVLGQAGSLFAVPACPTPFTGKQPDGKEFKIHLKGDEWTNWTETEDGYPIIINKNTRFWEYGKIGVSKKLSPTGQIVGKDAPVGINKISAKDLPARLDIRSGGPGKGFRTPRPNAGGGQAGASSPTSESPQSAPLNIIGTRKLLVILVGFADKSLTTTETSWVDRIFGATNSAKKYYDEVSYNQFNLAPAEETYGTINNGIVVVTLTSNHPNTGEDTDTRNQQLTKDAIIAADPYVNFASFDSNSDGTITTNELNVMIIAAGYETAYSTSSTPSVWAHKWAIDDITAPIVDGKTVGAYPGGYTQFGELHGTSVTNHQATIGVIIHEFAHDCGNVTTYLGLPDFYDTDSTSYGIGYWDSMASGMWLPTTGSYQGDTPSHFSAWCKWYSGWVTPTRITVSTNGVSFPQVETATGADHGIKQILSNPNGPEIGGTGEYFLIENRQKTGYDAGLPAAGILIWHIDETQNDNDTETRKLVDLEEADGLTQLDNKISKGDAGDPYPATTTNRTFNYTSNPNSRLYSGSDSNMSVTNISDSGATMTADINNSNTDQPPVLTSPGNKSVGENALLTFTLSASDPDGDTISYSMAGTPTGSTLNSTTGAFSWTPNYFQSGVYAMTFTATANSLSDSEPINITVNNVDRPPALTSPGNKSIDENQVLTFTLSATDPDGDTISYSMAGTPTGSTLNSLTGVFSWTPNYFQSGVYPVTFTATANSLSDSKSITITVNNIDRSPALTSPGNKSIDENQVLTFTLSATDPDGDTISYSMAGTPTGTTLNSATGIFNWTPDYTQIGIYSITFTATSNVLSDSKTITVTVLLIPPANLTATAISSYAIRLNWTDTSINETGFKIERSPDNITFTQISMVGSNITSTLDTNLSAETDYYYRIKAYNSTGNSDYSNVVSATTFALISAGSSGKGSHKAFSKCGCLGIEPLLILFLISLLGIRKSFKKNSSHEDTKALRRK